MVIDASVSIKWFVPENEGEQDTDQAIRLFKDIQSAEVDPIQPVHWQAEVIAVLSRIKPEISQRSIQLLDLLEFSACNSLEIYLLASEMAIELNHHLFDTLYHAVALEKNIDLITSDEKYYKKAKGMGNIMLLVEY